MECCYRILSSFNFIDHVHTHVDDIGAYTEQVLLHFSLNNDGQHEFTHNYTTCLSCIHFAVTHPKVQKNSNFQGQAFHLQNK